MEFAAYLHGEFARELASQGVDLDKPIGLALPDRPLHHVANSAAKLLFGLVLSSGVAAASGAYLPAHAAEDSVREIALLQELLASRGFDPGPIDGIKGDATVAAIIAAQEAYDLEPDGVVGPLTLAALQAAPPADAAESAPAEEPAEEEESEGVEISPILPVDALQQLLADRKFYSGAIDGIPGPLTETAILEAQKAYGLEEDGIAGPRTVAALLTEGATPAEEESDPAEGVEISPILPVDVLQQLLADRKFYSGAIDGIPGAQTEAAILAAQKAYGLEEDGIAGPRTIAALRADVPSPPPTTPAPPATKAATQELQALLRDRGFYTGAIDGILSSATREGIIRAQNFYGLAPDGVAGPATLEALRKDTFSLSAGTKPTPVVASFDVAQVQTLLAKRGFYQGAIDGVLGTETRNAIVRAQNFYGLTPTNGEPSTTLLASLQADPFEAKSA